MLRVCETNPTTMHIATETASDTEAGACSQFSKFEPLPPTYNHRALASSLTHSIPDHNTYTFPCALGYAKTIAAYNLTHTTGTTCMVQKALPGTFLSQLNPITPESVGELNWGGFSDPGDYQWRRFMRRHHASRHRLRSRTYTTTHTTSAGRRKSFCASPVHVGALFSSLKHSLPDYNTCLHTPMGNSKTITAFNLTHIWIYMHGPESNSANVSQAIEYNYPRESMRVLNWMASRIPAITNDPNACGCITRRTASSNSGHIRKLTLQVLGLARVDGPHQCV